MFFVSLNNEVEYKTMMSENKKGDTYVNLNKSNMLIYRRHTTICSVLDIKKVKDLLGAEN